MMRDVWFVGTFLAFWAVVILGSMYLTGTWYPLLMAIPFWFFTVEGDKPPPSDGPNQDA